MRWKRNSDSAVRNTSGAQLPRNKTVIIEEAHGQQSNNKNG